MILYSGNYLPDKSYKFYKVTISNRFFTGTQHLAFKAMAIGFDSDPDIYISKVKLRNYL